MDDKDFRQVQLQALCPTRCRWPSPDLEISITGDKPTVRKTHWVKLHAVVDEAMQVVAQAWETMDVIDADADLSSEGKARKKKRIALDAIAQLEASTTLPDAKEWIDRQLERWAEQTGMPIKAPSTVIESMLQSEIRAHLTTIKGNKAAFLQKHATDSRVASAVLTAPGFLSALTEAELALVRTKVERHVAPEVVKAREETLKAANEAEQAWHRAIAKIGKLGGLTKREDGLWADPNSDAVSAS